MGTVDPSLYTGDIDYVNLVQAGWWLIPLARTSLSRGLLLG